MSNEENTLENDTVSEEPDTHKYIVSGQVGAVGANAVVVGGIHFMDNKRSLREWWQKQILGAYGRYACYAMFLILPSDKEAIHYLTEYGREVDIISGENFLFLALTKSAFKLSEFDEWIWNMYVEEYCKEGYSAKVAELFGIDFTEFPCLIVFRDIRTPDHIAVTMKGLTQTEIAEKMRDIFARMQEAIQKEKDPLVAIQSYQAEKSLERTRRKVMSKAGEFIEKTFEAAMEAWMEVAIKQTP
jgi:hypothetical protein